MTAHIIDAVRALATTPTLLVALDFDGTVSHLDDDPMAVRAIPAAARVVNELAHTDDTYVAFVSGRALRDLAIISERPPVSPILLAGSHGAEYMLPVALADQTPADAAIRPADAAEVERAATAAVAGLPGARIESKTYGFALHTRLAAPDVTELAQSRVADVMAAAPDWRRRAGHDVREYAWRDEGKDDAVAYLRELTGATAVLFAGDDATDEDALASLSNGDLGVRVGEGATSATLRVADPEELASLLNVIASIRVRAAA
ncbi:trehalose-phosphatase [Microbacterium gorillae]|uniref:trehalose-phosphatase n=1 Tax=Microbacterium gorillae TaxID=1231063 RepID=UPI00058F310B|nr:trehalose-phosphatase [Microbacterium gorillae]